MNPSADSKPPLAINERVTWNIPGPALKLVTEHFSASRNSSVQTPKTHQNSASRKKATSRSKPLTKPKKLYVTKSRTAEQESWTIKTGRGRPYFRVRIADSGYRVQLCWTDTKPREPYCCYLSAEEWRAAKRRGLADFTRLIIAKLEERKRREGNSTAKIDALISRVRTVLH
jgi:hypothetical protein